MTAASETAITTDELIDATNDRAPGIPGEIGVDHGQRNVPEYSQAERQRRQLFAQ